VNLELSRVAASTEHDFLEVGSRLEEILSRARAQASTLASPLDQGEEHSTALSSTLAEITTWANGAGEVCGCATSMLQIAAALSAVQSALADLTHAARTLKVTGTLTRVESARLGDRAQSFEALSGEISTLAVNIDEKASIILQTTTSMRAMLENTRGAAQSLEHGKRSELTRVLAECEQAYAQLHGEQQRVLALTRSTHSSFEQVVVTISGLVMALQCQDSTRQRLEHIQSALRDLTSSTLSAQAMHLQSAQLADASQSFCSAVGAIRTGLDRLGETVARFSSEARAHAPGAMQSAGMEASYASIQSAMSQWDAIRLALGEAAATVRQSCAGLNGFVSEIEDVGVRMLRLALNAEIRAAHLAGEGAVMQAVAGEICRVARDAATAANTVARALREVTASTGSLMEDLARSGAASPAAAASRLSELTASLKGANGEKQQLLERVAADADALSHDIIALSRGIVADETMAAVCVRCVGVLDSLRASAPDADGAAALEEAQQRYTMHSERHVHQSVNPSAAPAEDAGLGDNVELF
jgi:hypothetical protein